MFRIKLLLLGLVLFSGAANALYDPTPEAALYAAQGEWRGTLTYKDYSEADKTVTLPVILFVALAGPDEMVLNYTFADGPGKTVFSYERMAFDFESKRVTWTSGSAERTATVARITSDDRDGPMRRVVFERPGRDGNERFTLELDAQHLSLQKEEVPATGETVLRNRFVFRRLST